MKIIKEKKISSFRFVLSKDEKETYPYTVGCSMGVFQSKFHYKNEDEAIKFYEEMIREFQIR